MEFCNESKVGGPAKRSSDNSSDWHTANPPTCFHQDEYPDYYFRVTKSEHRTDLKSKFKKFCKNSMISKRYLHVNEKVLQENPSFVAQMAPSLDKRLDMEIEEIPKLAAEAAKKAIMEWGRPKSHITHLVFHSTLGIVMPGVDYELIHLLGLDLSVNQTMLYQLGCYAGGTVIRVAKDIAENNAGARVLVVCSEVLVTSYRAPTEAHIGILVGHAIFGDGASALIVGSDPDLSIERPLFQIMSASQTIIPDTHDEIEGRFREVGFIYNLSEHLYHMVGDNISACVEKACKPLGITDWNSLFWMVHTGGPNILNMIEKRLNLDSEKLKVTRHVLREYGNMLSPSLLFVIDEMRKKSVAQGSATTGEGLKWEIALGFGPGLTIETLVLRSIPLVEH